MSEHTEFSAEQWKRWYVEEEQRRSADGKAYGAEITRLTAERDRLDLARAEAHRQGLYAGRTEGRREGAAAMREQAADLVEGDLPRTRNDVGLVVDILALTLPGDTPRPACCTCDPAACDTDESGDSCLNCASCMNGCPAEDGECCNQDAES